MRSPWTWAALAVASGLAYAASFPSEVLWPLAFVAFWPFFYAIERGRPSGLAALGIGALFGFVVQLASADWLIATLVRFFDFHLASSVAVVGLYAAVQAGQLALVGYVLGRANAAGLRPSWVAAPVLAAAELAYPLVFPRYLGSSFHSVPVVLQVADLGGPILVSVLAILASGAGYELLVSRWWRRPSVRLCAACALSWAAAIAYGRMRLTEVDARVARSEALNVGIVQANIGTVAKRDDPGRTYRAYLEQSLELESKGELDLVVWPETAAGFVSAPRRKLGALGAPLLFGGIESVERDGRKAFYNSGFLVSRTSESGPYRKEHLLPFGEYLPFGDVFPSLYALARNTTRFTPGTGTEPLALGSHRISVMICYEDILPSFVRGMVGEAAPELLVNLTDDAWFGETREPWMHLALARLRAVEHHRYLVRATNTGVSAIIDPAGRLAAHSGVYEAATLRGTVRWLGGRTLYERSGDWPGWISVLATAWLLFRSRNELPPAVST